MSRDRRAGVLREREVADREVSEREDEEREVEDREDELAREDDAVRLRVEVFFFGARPSVERDGDRCWRVRRDGCAVAVTVLLPPVISSDQTCQVVTQWVSQDPCPPFRASLRLLQQSQAEHPRVVHLMLAPDPLNEQRLPKRPVTEDEHARRAIHQNDYVPA